MRNCRAAVDSRMDHHSTRKRLIAVERDLILLAESIRNLPVVTRRAQDICPAARRFDRLVGAREILRCQKGRHQTVLRRSAGVEALGHRAEHLTKPNRLGRREPEGPDHLLFRKTEYFARGCGRAERPHGAGNVPADVVMLRIDSVGDSAFHFHADNERMQKIGARARAILGERQKGRRDGRGGMNDGAQIGIVEIENV